MAISPKCSHIGRLLLYLPKVYFMAKQKKTKVISKCDVHNTDYVTVLDHITLDSTFKDGYVTICRFYNFDTYKFEYIITRLCDVKVTVQDDCFIDLS